MTLKYPTETFIGFCLLIFLGSSFTINTVPTNHPENIQLLEPIFVYDSNFNFKRFLESIQVSAQKVTSQTVKGISNSESTSKPASSSNTFVPDTSTNAKVANTQFNGLILYHYIPAILSNQEYFEIRGRILSPADNQRDSFVGFAFFSTKESGRYDFVKKLQFGATEFSILLNLKAIPPGQYEIGANVAWEWSNSPTKRTLTKNTSVLSLQSAPQSPQNFKIDLKNNKLVFSWNEDNKTSIEKISFSQGGTNREYILSNFVSKFEVPYQDFFGFKQGEVKVELSSARSRTSSLASRNSQYSSQVSLTFVATRHRSSNKIDQDQISFDEEIPWQLGVEQRINLKGTTKDGLRNKIVVELPNKTFSSYYFNENEDALTVGSGVYFNVQIPVNSEGSHMIEILNQNGQPVMNRPVYAGNVYPLLPNYIDLQPKEIDPKAVSNAQPNTLQKQRAKLFQLINEKRVEYGARVLTQDESLDRLAQSHSQDMVVYEYFSHVNGEGETPQDRAILDGVNQKVQEIIAMNINLTEAHLEIINSPSNLQIMVNPQSTNVGLGVARTSDRIFKITQIYGGQSQFILEITEQVLSALKSKIVLQVISQYSYIQNENVRLSIALTQWLNMSIEQQEAIQFGRFLETKGFNDFIRKEQIFTYGLNLFETKLKGQFLNPDNPAVTQFGVAIRKVSESEVEIYVVFV